MEQVVNKSSVMASSTTSSAEHASSDAKSGPPTTVTNIVIDSGVDPRENEEARVAFLATFSAEESKSIMRKVDRRFFVLIGVMFMFKSVSIESRLVPRLHAQRLTFYIFQMCYSNASTVKVLQVGEASNILTELRMSLNDYNWVSSIYGVSLGNQ